MNSLIINKEHKILSLKLLLGAFTLFLLVNGCTGTSNPDAPTEDAVVESQSSNSSLLRSTSSQGTSGVQVIGVGKVEVQPQLARVNVGVEVFSTSVGAATKSASKSLNRMIISLTSDGILNDEIITKSYGIQPTYEWQDTVKNGARTSERILTGYVVTNTIEVIIRDMESIGTVLDNLTIAGGDNVRLNSVSFGAEDLESAEKQAIVLATQDAMVKASLIAQEMGIRTGRVLHVSESSTAPRDISFSYDTRALAMMEAPTPINAGDLTVTASVFAIFEIE